MREQFDYMEDPEVLRIIRQQSVKVAEKFNLDAHDFEQEAYILVATKEDIRAAYDEGNYSLVAYRLRGDLINYAEKLIRRTSREVYGHEELDEGFIPTRMFDDLAFTGFRGGSGG